MFCMKCGVELPENALFCYRCGQKVIQLKNNDIDKQKSDCNAIQYDYELLENKLIEFRNSVNDFMHTMDKSFYSMTPDQDEMLTEKNRVRFIRALEICRYQWYKKEIEENYRRIDAFISSVMKNYDDFGMGCIIVDNGKCYVSNSRLKDTFTNNEFMSINDIYDNAVAGLRSYDFEETYRKEAIDEWISGWGAKFTLPMFRYNLVWRAYYLTNPYIVLFNKVFDRLIEEVQKHNVDYEEIEKMIRNNCLNDYAINNKEILIINKNYDEPHLEFKVIDPNPVTKGKACAADVLNRNVKYRRGFGRSEEFAAGGNYVCFSVKIVVPLKNFNIRYEILDNTGEFLPDLSYKSHVEVSWGEWLSSNEIMIKCSKNSEQGWFKMKLYIVEMPSVFGYINL